MRGMCGAAAVAVVCGGATAQTGFWPATERVAVEPPPNIRPVNAARVILGLSERYVYRTSNTSTAWGQAAMTTDFVNVEPLALPPGGVTSYPVGVSDDGRRVLGLVAYGQSNRTRAVLWEDQGDPLVCAIGNIAIQKPMQTNAACDRWVITTGAAVFDFRSYLAGPDGFAEIVAYEGDVVSTYSRAISPDGETAACIYNGAPGPSYVWDELQGPRQLLPQVAIGLLPMFVSDGGETVVCGEGGSGDPNADFLVSGVYWRGTLRRISSMWCTDMRRDGAVLLGYSLESTPRAEWWTRTLGIEDLREALVARGIDLRGWTLREARYITDDGRMIVGRGRAPGGTQDRWWVAQIEPLSAADIGKAGGVGGSDGKLDNNDLIEFISRFFASDERADMGRAGGERGGDGLFDNNDFCAFISLFFNAEP